MDLSSHNFLQNHIYYPERSFDAVTLIFFFSSGSNNGGENILLGYKKRGIGHGKYVGIGGHVEEGEDPVDAALRETYEEIGVKVEELKFQGNLEFIFLDPHVNNMYAYLYTASHWKGKISESEEISPQWFEIDGIPYEKMWQDAQGWMKYLIDRKQLVGKIIVDLDNESVLKTSLKIW